MSEKPRHGQPPALPRRLARGLWTWTWRGVAFGLILAAVLLTLARLLLPFASEYRAELEQRVESYLGTEVAIAGLDIGWHGFVPRMRLSEVVIEGAGASGETITFDRAYVSLWPAWIDGAPTLRVTDVSLLGLELALRVDEGGRVHVLGATLDPAKLVTSAASASVEGGASTSVGEAFAGVFGVSRLQLLDTTLVVTGPEGGVTRWHDVELRLANAGDRHRLSLVMTPPGDWGEALRAVLEFAGKPTAYREWRGRLFVEGENLALDRWSMLWPQAPVRFRDGHLDLALWSDWAEGRLQDAQARVAAGNLRLLRADREASVRFGRLAGHLRLWQPSPSQWQLDVDRLQVRRDGQEWSGDGLSLAREDGGGWRLAADFLRLDDVVAVMPLLPLEEDLLARLAGLTPRGDLQGLSLALSAAGDFRLQTDFRGLGWLSDGRIPGMRGLDGRARLGDGGGEVVLDSRDVVFDGPRLFREPLQLRELSARVGITRGHNGLVLDAPRIHARNADLRGRGRARIELARGESPLLDLHFVYQDGDARATSTYLPAGIMPAPVVSWLDRAFRDGRLEQGSFTFFGRAGDFPFRDHEGVFDVRFDVADVTLRYAGRWPEIEDVGGRVHFAGAGLDIRIDGGSMNGVRLQRGRARFADLKDGLLEVNAEATGPLAGMLGVINGSPLAPRFAPVFGGAEAAGNGTLALALTIPVKDVDATRVDGELRLSDAALAQPRHDLALDHIDGSVRFTRRTVTIDGLEANLRGRPFRLDAHTEDGTATFRARGEFTPAELYPPLDQGILAGSEGRSAWDLRLRVPLTAEGRARLEASSDLRGTRIALPPPLAKPAGEARPVQLEIPLAVEGRQLGWVRYGDDTRLVLEFDAGAGPQPRRLGVGLGEFPELPRQRGMRVAGEVTRLPLADWLAAAGDRTGPMAGPPLTEVDLRVDVVSFHERRLSQVRLQGARDEDGWRLDIASNEASGKLEIPVAAAAGDPVRARFGWIDLALLAGDEESGAGDRGLPIEPENLPPLDLRVTRLKLAEVTLADFALVTGTSGAGRSIHRVDFHTEHLRASGQGLWRGGPDPRTQLRLTLRSGDFGKGLAELGHGEVMAKGDGSVTFDLDWPAPPWDPTVATLQGHVELDLENGVLRQVNPGAARLLGMFSFETIPFRTLLQEGLIFSRLRGRVDLDDGNAYTGNFKIDSAIGKIRIRGRTGLVAHDYDLRVQVEPELSTSLPVIGFLSGGPAVGAAIALVQGVMRNLGQDVERVTGVEYSVTGSWDEPKVVRTGKEEAESDADSPSVREYPR